MVKLSDMRDVEFPAYRRLFIDEYAQDLAATRGYGAEDARARATESIDGSLSAGVRTAANRLWCIVPAGEEQPVIGYLWIVVKDQAAWVADFCLLPEWRGRGFGRAALGEMDRLLAAMGINEVGLRVAAGNGPAKALYEKCGFHITGFNMSRSLAALKAD